MTRPIKMAKTKGASEAFQFLYFKYWSKAGKHRVYITDYKLRTLGYVDLDDENKVVISDRQGNTQSEIDYALEPFFLEYIETGYYTAH